MEWLSENWVWVVVGVAFVAMHPHTVAMAAAGAMTRAAKTARMTSLPPRTADTGIDLIKETLT